VNFAVLSGSASAILVSLFDLEDREIGCFELPGRTGDVFHGHIAGIGPGARYGLRASGPFAPGCGHRFNSAKLLVDPFALRLDRPFKLHPAMFDSRIYGDTADGTDSAPFVPKAIVERSEALRLPRHPVKDWGSLLIYEMHVRGFTKRREEIPEAIRGTFAALAHEASVDYLRQLGVTAVELLPVAAWIDERHLPPLGLSNYWGYNPIALLAPDPRLAPGGWEEARAAVDALHAAGIAVILDVVLNHTGESDEFGPTLSLRGLDNAGFYRLYPGSLPLYVNDSGCGNVLALERPMVLRLAIEAMRTAVIRSGIDGFRYDLATVLGRRDQGFDPGHPFFAAIQQDPWLRDLIHIAEPWDLGPDGYKPGAFPASWGEWNGRSRDIFRRFWRGDSGVTGMLATALAGSTDMFAPRHRPLSRSVNFATAHDGFTLADLVSYENKRNHANGEENRDGANDNFSWNCGTEGPAIDAATAARRASDARALLVTLLGARGTPMLAMGDEIGRSQQGNNNAYAQDNELTWIDWQSADSPLLDFTARLIRLRRSTGALNSDAPLTGQPADETGIPDVEWLKPDGLPMLTADWDDHAIKVLMAAFYAPGGYGRTLSESAPSRSALLLNGSDQEITWKLPEPRPHHAWMAAIDSAKPHRAPLAVSGEHYVLASRAAAILVERPSQTSRRALGVADHLLTRLASEAGIAPYWFDVRGARHDVSAETKRALLAALGLPADSSTEARASLAILSEERALRPLPIASVIRQSSAATLRLGGCLAGAGRRIRLHISCEDGTLLNIAFSGDEGERAQITAADGRSALVRSVPLPPLPLGRHKVFADEAPYCLSHLAAVPSAAYLPEAMRSDARALGITAQLYALRHEPPSGAADQGIGDFTTLALLAQGAAAAGAGTVGINPLHALFPNDPERASPYHPSDRRFLNPLAIDVFGLPDPFLTPRLRAAIEEAQPEARRLSALTVVDYSAVARLKNVIFDAAHSAFEELARNRPRHALIEDCAAFIRKGGERLRHFAIFTAVEAKLKEKPEKWPEPLRSPMASGVDAFAKSNEEAVSRAMFLQWLADRQLFSAASAARSAGLSLGLYRDLAVGCAPDGAEAWAEAGSFMRGLSIGAPPDPLGPNGQIWGLPPYNPRALACDGFSAYSWLIAANMAHAGLLRIDHVAGLKRLFLVPEGASGGEGAYLDYPFDDLAGHIALESQRNKTAVIGEDLGTVPEGLREKLAEAQILSCRVMHFERQGEELLPPDQYPRLAAACIATHDLPPLAGWWAGEDIKEAVRLGLTANAQAAKAAREAEKSSLIRAIAGEGLLSELPQTGAQLTEAGAAAVHGYAARSNAVLTLVQADDLAMEPIAVNMPGTDRERPNWRHKVSVAVQLLFNLRSAKAILREVRCGREYAATKARSFKRTVVRRGSNGSFVNTVN
jgi:glycogen operon protein